MGVVYTARDESLDRTVALKFLSPDSLRDPEMRARFVREAKTASSLQHPNICTIHDIQELSDGQMFIAMDYYSGPSLQELLQGGPVELDRAIGLVLQILQGLEKAHQQGIVHRDIKPANVLTTDDGLVKIVDFGLAKATGASLLTREATTLGTVAYMSPEQARGSEIDHRTDIWSVGVLLYELLTGTRPFASDYDQAVIYGILNEDPRPVAELRPEAGEDVQRVVAKALAKDPEERYQSCSAFEQDLHSVLSGAPSPQEPGAAAQRANPRRRPLTVIASVVGVISLALVSVLVFLPGEPTFDTIAVLPLNNLSQNPESDYFADGMTDALITELAQIKGFRKVSSRTSVMQFKDAQTSLPEIANLLGVAAIVEGAVQLQGTRVAINVKLIDGVTEQHLWARSYERSLTDIISLQREISGAIAEQIRLSLSLDDRERLSSGRKVHPEAHTLYLKGMHLLDHAMTTHGSIVQSIAYFREAVQKDSSYAPAWSALAVARTLLAAVGYERLRDAAVEARRASSAAYALDPDLPMACVAQGLTKFWFEWDWAGSLKAFTRAVELNPHDAWALSYYSYALLMAGRAQEGLQMIRHAQEVSPLSPSINTQAALRYLYTRQFDRAISTCEDVLSLDPENVFTVWVMATAYSHKGEYRKSIELFLSRKVPDPSTNWMLGRTYGRAGDTIQARRVLQFLYNKSRSTYIQPAMIAAVHVGLGETDAALELLERAYEDRDTWMETLTVDPMWDPLRDEPRFSRLVQKMGLSDPSL